MESIMEILKDPNLDYRQRRLKMAQTLENQLPYVKIKKESQKLLEEGVICDLFEGHAPYRPRYILPDYKKFLLEGSEYLNIKPPCDMYEAINALLIIYSYVPSITSYPVFLGNIDELLEPYVDTVTEAELTKLLKMFLINIDRTLPDAFVHMDIGPKDTVVGTKVLEIEKELKKAIPNISLKIDDNTSKDYKLKAVETALEIGKPYFINHKELASIKGENYAIASCYNSLLVGGGSFTLVRLNLKALAQKASSFDNFKENILINGVECLCDIIDARAKFLVEECGFFEHSFLAKEGFITMDRFTSMAGIFGLYEAVEFLSGGLKLGTHEKAGEMAKEILGIISSYLNNHKGAYCYGNNGRIGFHAQSGIDTDKDVTAGVRIKIGEEPSIYNQIKIESQLQKYFDTGVSDIYLFDKTASKNPEGVLNIIEGAFKDGMRIMAINSKDSELIRITGYLVKRSDIDKFNKGEALREGTIALGAGSVNNNNILGRKVNSLNEQ